MEGLLSIFLMIFSSSLLVFCVFRAAYTLWWIPMKLDKELKQEGIKGSPYRLLIGDYRELGRSMKEGWSKPMALNHQIVPRAIPFLHEALQKHGKISVLWIGTQPRVIISDPELMKVVLTNKLGHIEQTRITNPFIKLLAMGVSTMDGEKWAKHRRIINPAFHLEKLKGMIPAISTSCNELIKRWEEFTLPQGSYELDVSPELQNLTGDVISRTAFSSNYKEGQRIFQLQKEQIALMIEAAYNLYVPGFKFIPTRKNRRRMYLDKEIKATLRDLIHKKEQGMKNGESSNDDLLGLLLQSNSNNSTPKDTGLTIEEVIEECKLFYFAGQETTAVLLTWTLIVLSMHPRWQDQAREEVLHVCGKNSPNIESINHLKIVTMILYEVLRLYPPVPAVYRHTRVRTQVGEKSIPPGVELLFPTILIHHDPLTWGSDAQEFNPERFSDGISKASNDELAFFPFGWGPKICVGMNFAMIEARMAMAMILQHFSFELSPLYTHAPFTLITLQPQHGAQIILHRL
ncbi:hypothetical protein AAC387_Pa06g1008 [Persea americana]